VIIKGTYRQLCQTILEVERLPSGRSMMLGAIAFLVYVLNVSWVFKASPTQCSYRNACPHAHLVRRVIWLVISGRDGEKPEPHGY